MSHCHSSSLTIPLSWYVAVHSRVLPSAKQNTPFPDPNLSSCKKSHSIKLICSTLCSEFGALRKSDINFPLIDWIASSTPWAAHVSFRSSIVSAIYMPFLETLLYLDLVALLKTILVHPPRFPRKICRILTQLGTEIYTQSALKRLMCVWDYLLSCDEMAISTFPALASVRVKRGYILSFS